MSTNLVIRVFITVLHSSRFGKLSTLAYFEVSTSYNIKTPIPSAAAMSTNSIIRVFITVLHSSRFGNFQPSLTLK
jgi:hypothetical protein